MGINFLKLDFPSSCIKLGNIQARKKIIHSDKFILIAAVFPSH